MLRLLACAAVVASLAASGQADGRELTSQVTELAQIPRVRPEFPVPNEPHMLFYIERSSNSNTVIYAAHLDADGQIDRDTPVNAYWRWYNVDGHKKPLNFIERMMAYGVKSVAHKGSSASFDVAALPDRRISVDLDGSGHPEALMQIDGRTVKLVYVYLQVDDHGLMPDVTAMDIFGIDKATGKAVREHVVPH
jgi:Domain of unknown function (DUF4833)